MVNQPYFNLKTKENERKWISRNVKILISDIFGRFQLNFYLLLIGKPKSLFLSLASEV